MFNLKIFILALFAVMASYLMLTIPMASATQVNIYWETTPGSDPIPTGVSQTIPTLGITRSLSLSANTLSLDVYNSTAVLVDIVYVYTCGDNDPQDCALGTPDVYNPDNSNLHAEYIWSDVRGPSGNGNFLILVKAVNNGESSWMSYWHHVTSGGADQSYDITEVRLVTNDIGKTENIRSFIETWGMLPFSSSWGIISAVFVGASTMFDMQSTTGPPALTPSEISGDTANKTPTREDYTYIIPSGAQTWNGVTLFNNPTYTLNNNDCEAGLGETYAVQGGCLDCPCPSGLYCDGEQGGAFDGFVCRSTSTIRLEVVGTYGISDCSVSHNVDLIAQIPSRLETPSHPTDLPAQLPGRYTINGISSVLITDAATTCTERLDGRYDCPAIIPADPNCGGQGDYSTQNNILEVDVNYWDGESPVSATLTDTFTIGVGTYTCGGGRGNCEASSGESETNCCYDCACSTEGQYCDWDTTSGTGSCKLKLTENSIQASMENVRQDPGRGSIADITYTITPKPDSIQSLTITGCTVDCSPACTATCTTGGCIEESTDNAYILECKDASFLISDYDLTKDYNLDPTFDAVLRYYDGPDLMTESYSLRVGSTTLASDFCGDSVCSVTENNINCCYDCVCDTGEFCSWDDTIAKSAGTCESLDGISISSAVLDDTSFTAATRADGKTSQIITNVTFAVSGAVYGFEGPATGTSCEFDGNTEADLTGARCTISSCEEAGPNRIRCELTVPPIDYTVSSFYNRVLEKVVITPNTAFVAIKILDGARARIDHYLTIDLPDITITPLGSCVMGSPCEEHLGETPENCCINCGCAEDGFVCIPGDRTNSTCMNESEIVLLMDFPEVECWIAPTSISGGNCTFLSYTEQGIAIPKAADFTATLYNAPADLDVERFWYTFEGEEYEVRSYMVVNNTITTKLTLADIPNAVPGTYSKDFSVKTQVNYLNDAGSVVTVNLTDNITFGFDVGMSNEAVICNTIIDGFDDEVKDLTKTVTQARHWGWGFVITGTVLMIIAFLPFVGCGYPCFIIGCIMAAVGLATVMWAYSMNNALKELETVADRADLCIGTALEYHDYKNAIKAVNRAASMALIGSIIMAAGLILLCVAIGESIDWSTGSGGEAASTGASGKEATPDKFLGKQEPLLNPDGTQVLNPSTGEPMFAIPDGATPMTHGQTLTVTQPGTFVGGSGGASYVPTGASVGGAGLPGGGAVVDVAAGATSPVLPSGTYSILGGMGNGGAFIVVPAASQATAGFVMGGIILTTTGLTMTGGGMSG